MKAIKTLKEYENKIHRNFRVDNKEQNYIKDIRRFVREYSYKNNIDYDYYSILFNLIENIKVEIHESISDNYKEKVETASELLIKLTKDNKNIENEFYISINDYRSDYEKLAEYLIKNADYWLNEIQEALKNEDYDLLSNGSFYMFVYSNYILCPDIYKYMKKD